MPKNEKAPGDEGSALPDRGVGVSGADAGRGYSKIDGGVDKDRMERFERLSRDPYGHGGFVPRPTSPWDHERN